MNRRNLYEAAGFVFENPEMMEKAKKEEEGIRYIKKRTDMKDPDMVFQVYCQMAEQRLFETPVGYAFLYELQEYLITIPSIRNEDIPAIYVGQVKQGQKKSISEKNQSKNTVKSQRERVSKRKDEKPAQRIKNLDFKMRFKTSLFINIILVLIVAGMFAIAATSKSANILNYEESIIQKYEQWEKELEKREAELTEKENGQGSSNMEEGSGTT